MLALDGGVVGVVVDDVVVVVNDDELGIEVG